MNLSSPLPLSPNRQPAVSPRLPDSRRTSPTKATASSRRRGQPSSLPSSQPLHLDAGSCLASPNLASPRRISSRLAGSCLTRPDLASLDIVTRRKADASTTLNRLGQSFLRSLFPSRLCPPESYLNLMAMPEASPAPSAKVVGNAFVEQYYHILHQSPELVHRFYHDSSLLSRPDAHGVMTTVTTMQAINDKILSLNYEDYTAEIRTADAQDSHEKGVIVLITGCLTGKDNVRKKFTQTFFLAPQDKGYFVLNDVFRFVEEEDESSQINSVSLNDVSENASVPALTPEPEPIPVVAPTTSIEEEGSIDGAEVCDPSDNEGSAIEEEVVEPPTQSSQNEELKGDNSAPAAQEDTPKKSYASIVKVMKSTPGPVYVPTGTVRAPANTDQQSHGSVKPASAPEVAAPTSDNAPESSSVTDEAEGHSIYIRNLPYNATVAQLEEVFKTFGPIKRGGIQVRSNKQGFTFGFVEFEAVSSMQSALEASPVTIGDRQAVVEEKRTTTRVSAVGNSVRGKFSTGRGGFRNDSFRARGNFGGGRGYGRSEFRNQGEYSGRSRSSSGRNGEGGYQRVNQNGTGGRGGRQGGGVNRGSVPA